MSKQVTYETDPISLLCDSTMSSALSLCFLCILLQSKKKKIILEEIKIIKKEMHICENNKKLSCLRLIQKIFGKKKIASTVLSLGWLHINEKKY